jgi:hypothetical protein
MTNQSFLKFVSALGALCAAGLGMNGCENALTENPPHILVADNLFLDNTGFQAGLNGLYSLAREERRGVVSGVNDIKTEMWSLGTDTGWSIYYPPNLQGYNLWGAFINPDFSEARAVWTWLYQTINTANTIIDRAANPDVRWTEAQKNQTVGEARLIRAWAYWHLTSLFGDVPLNLVESSGTTIRSDWERTPVAEVQKQMEQDLLFAEQVLPNTTKDAAHVSKAVAEHYLAELYLTMNQPAKAEEKAEAVINSGDYHLITQRYGVNASKPGVPFMDQFMDGNVNRNQGNTEVLWSFQNQLNTPGGGGTPMRRHWVNRYWNIKGVAISAEYGGRGIGSDAPTAWAIDNYEPQDDRGSIYAIRKFYLYNTTTALPAGKQLGDTVYLKWKTGTESTTSWDWPSTRKWDWMDPSNPTGEFAYGDQPYLRLAETYLLLAEAEMKLGKLSEAAEHLNVVRRRAHASEIGPGQVTMDFILDERARELLTEEHRRYTLVRTGKWLERTRKYNPVAGPHVAEHNALYPIPQVVIDANLDSPMAQNPGY